MTTTHGGWWILVFMTDLMHKSNKFQLRVPAPALLVKAVIKIQNAPARSQRAGRIRGSVHAGKAQRALCGALATATRVQRNEMQRVRSCEAAVPDAVSFDNGKRPRNSGVGTRRCFRARKWRAIERDPVCTLRCRVTRDRCKMRKLRRIWR
jgi:hypothetical protein